MIKFSRVILAACPAALLLLGMPEPSWALQPHGAPEGLYVHQMAHILFMGALAYLYLHTRRTASLTSEGWRYLRHFCILLILWNLLAFTGHAAARFLSPEDILNKGTWHARLASPVTTGKITYMLSRMDHLIYIPALLALMISLRTFYIDAKKGKEE